MKKSHSTRVPGPDGVLIFASEAAAVPKRSPKLLLSVFLLILILLTAQASAQQARLYRSSFSVPTVISEASLEYEAFDEKPTVEGIYVVIEGTRQFVPWRNVASLKVIPGGPFDVPLPHWEVHLVDGRRFSDSGSLASKLGGTINIEGRGQYGGHEGYTISPYDPTRQFNRIVLRGF